MMIKKSRVLCYIEFHQSQNPAHVEQQLRECASRGMFPPFRGLMVAIDHKNLKRIEATPVTVMMDEKDSIE